ncbi:hypothetical protein OH146_03075 [Salinibacterium sp. SYSU T00001]|uniref:hypothetical protein n=1 Tax=Homoserinimonas sedimenticola TaxID=2986805 RepID=UPI002235E4C4|nr:hypothetical protein [Salinibacterium sedimenticola]MCW4384751.1 hypothetical protein [Salinibacterium sedimenticola]
MTSVIEKRGVVRTDSARTIQRQEAQRSAEIAWTEMGHGVWVAKRGSDFAGLIEELWGAGYRVTDRTGAIVGEFATLQSARRRIE